MFSGLGNRGQEWAEYGSPTGEAFCYRGVSPEFETEGMKVWGGDFEGVQLKCVYSESMQA